MEESKRVPGLTRAFVALLVAVSLAACGGDESKGDKGDDGNDGPGTEQPGPKDDDGPGPDVNPEADPLAPELGTGDHSPSSVTLTEIAGPTQGLRGPRDLAFNPRKPGELWAVNYEDNSVVVVFDAHLPSRTYLKKTDAYAIHFMHQPSSIAFGADETTIGKPGTFATCQESRNTYGTNVTGNDFMGPVLWSSDLSVFAGSDPNGLGAHLDMLHGSPMCAGIAHERNNVYWAFGGKKHTVGASAVERNQPAPAIVKYDFATDDGIGNDDHSDGQMYQYVTNQVKGLPGVSSHLFFHPADSHLYIADTGNARVVKLDTTSGTQGRALTPQEPQAAYFMMDDATLTEVVPESTGYLVNPSGIEIHNGLLYVSDFETGRISAFTLQGERVNYLDTGLPPGSVSGFAFGPDGKLYLVDQESNRVLRIDPKTGS